MQRENSSPEGLCACAYMCCVFVHMCVCVLHVCVCVCVAYVCVCVVHMCVCVCCLCVCVCVCVYEEKPIDAPPLPQSNEQPLILFIPEEREVRVVMGTCMAE